VKYHDVIVEAFDVRINQAGDKQITSYRVRVFASPAGEMTVEQAANVQCEMPELESDIAKLAARELEGERLIELGRRLGLLILPLGLNESVTGVRELFARSLDRIPANEGLRLRLRLPTELAPLPWEYVYIERFGGEDSVAGFVSLDPRVVMVRHEALPVLAATVPFEGNLKIVAAFASPPELAPLDIKQERANLLESLQARAGIDEPTILAQAKSDDLQTALPGATVFHFAGHGTFIAPVAGQATAGKGSISLLDGNIDAEQLGITLRGNGIRLAVLGACKTATRDAKSVWGGIAPVLCRCDVPAVVANQFSIKDKCAVAFSRQFYSSLVGGLSLERAVAAGRISAFRADKEGRDWGVPVLYLRAPNGELVKGAPDATVRQAARQAAEADVEVYAKEVAAGGVVVGAEVKKFIAGKLRANVTIDGTVYGNVTGLIIDQFSGGAVSSKADVDVVGSGGNLTGVKIDKFG
jgi:CHAT domain-containing protein